MSLMTERITLHLRAQQVGTDPFGEPLYGDPEEVSGIPAWWEPAGSTEDLTDREQITESYWVYTGDYRLQASSEVTLHSVGRDIRCELSPPQPTPAGFELDGFVRALATRTAG